ncbi:MAG TPA: hypothetical protein VKY51_05205, partial [Fredinandcohnia sp.]|nr:hypothetical protein [Fredinandcohnia sp.]
PLQGALDAVLGALRSGGPILAGVAALSAGIGLLVTKIKEARQESERLGALEKVAGISRREVDELRASLADAGVQLSRMDAAALARVAQAAKISREELEANAEAIQALATLDGITFESAAKRFFEDLAASAAKVREGISRVRDALEGVRGLAPDPALEAGEESLRLLLEQERQLEEIVEQRRQEAIIAEEAWVRNRAAGRTEHEAYLTAKARLEATQAELAAVRQQIAAAEDLLVQYQLEKDAKEAAKKAEQERKQLEEARQKAAEKAAQRERQSIDTAIEAAKLRRDQEAVVQLQMERRLKLIDELAKKELITEQDAAIERVIAQEQAERARLEIVRERQRKEEDLELQHRARMAAVTKSRLDDLQVAMDQELALVERALEDEVIQVEEAERRKALIREYYAAQRKRTAEEEAREAARREQAAADKQERELATAYSLGFSAAASLAQGLREGLEQGETRAILRGLLGALALVATLAGGPAIGAAVGGLATLFAGFFSEGGMIRGPRSTRRDNLLVAAEDGEFIVNREATRRHRGLLEAINSGRLPAFAGAFAGGGLVGAAASGTGGAPVQIFVAAMDPQQTADVLAHRIEPAQRLRGMTRQDEALIAQARTRIVRRTGRRR